VIVLEMENDVLVVSKVKHNVNVFSNKNANVETVTLNISISSVKARIQFAVTRQLLS